MSEKYVFKVTCYPNDEYLVVASNYAEAETVFTKRYNYKDIECIEKLKYPLI